jgi:adenylate kinase
MDAGKLVADDIVIGIVEQRLQQPDASSGFILDGFPRNTAQAQVLDKLLDGHHQHPIDKAVHLAVDDEEIIHRLHDRAVKEGRHDDQPDVIRHRIEVYNAQTHPLLDYYDAQGKLVTLQGVGTVEEIMQSILKVLA